MNFITVIFTSLLSVVTLFFMTKLTGAKQVSELTLFDYVISISIGSIAAELATELENPLYPFLALLVYGFVSYLISKITMKSIKFRRLIFGNTITLMRNGKLIKENFRKAHIDLNEFLVQMRAKGYFDISSVNTAVLEPSGKISVLPYSQNRPVTPTDLKIVPNTEDIFFNVIIDGEVMAENLKQSGFDEGWLKCELKARNNTKLHEILLGTLDKNGTLNIFKGDEPSPNTDFFE